MSLQNSRSAFPSTPGTTNKALLQRVREGDEQAWNEFYCKYLNMIRKAGRRQGLSPEECQDLMTEVMVIFWRKMTDFIYTPEKGRFRSYLNRIADFVSLKMHRANRRHAQAPEVGDYPEYVDTGCMNEWRDYLLEKALEDLRANVDTVTYMAFHLLTFQHRTVKDGLSSADLPAPHGEGGGRHHRQKGQYDLRHEVPLHGTAQGLHRRVPGTGRGGTGPAEEGVELRAGGGPVCSGAPGHSHRKVRPYWLL